MLDFSALSGYRLTPAAVLTGLESLSLFAIGIGLARRRNRDSSSLRRFSAFILLTAATLGSLAMMYAAPTDSAAKGWTDSALFFVPWAPLFLYALVMTVEPRSRIAVPSILLAAFLSVLALRTNLFLGDFHEYWWGRYGQAKPMIFALIAFWLSLMILGLTVLVRHSRSETDPARRERLRELRLVLLVGFIAGLDFVPSFGIGLPPVGGLLVVFLGARAFFVRRVTDRLFPVTIAMAANHVVDAMADAVVVIDEEGQIVVVNHALETMLGFSANELEGKGLESLVAPHEEDTTRSDRMRAVLHGRTIRDIERVLRTKTGVSIPVSISMSAMTHGEGGIVLVIRDIRERKSADDEVRRTASLLRSILDSTNDAILVVGTEGRILSWNRRLVEVVGLSIDLDEETNADELLETILAKVRNRNTFADEIMRSNVLLEDTSSVILELKDGRVYECSSIPHRLDGEILGRVWSMTDVTEKRRAEEALRTSEGEYRRLFERNAAGVYRSALDGTILACNDAYARILGFRDSDELVGANGVDFFYDSNERESLVSMLKEVGSLTGVELRLKRRDGREIWVLENLTVIPDSEMGRMVVEGTLVDISSLKIAEEQMEFQAYHDVLTVLPNRRLFIDRLTLALAHSRRSNDSLAVMFLDLDNFKTVNDTMGHTAGDELLLAVAERLRGSVREEDTVARIGGDEFTILTAGLKDPKDAIVVAEKILASVSRPIHIGKTELSVTASVGVAFYPDDGADSEALIKSSDSALYRAKELGKNNYQLCTPQLKVRAIERVAIENELRESISRGGLLLHYQPIVRLDNGEVSTVEALVRWNHPKRGVVMPSGFMGIAEDARLTIPIDHWVINEACRQLRVWHDGGFSRLRVSVNISAHQLQQREFPRRIEETLSRHGIASDQLSLELKESAILEALDVGVPILNKLRDIGVSISIDDFGTGFSSLNYLKNLPIDGVKIDNSLVASLTVNSSDAAIVAAIIDIARLLNLRVVAEGVEKPEQVRLLRERRCHELQGHLFSAAIPPMILEDVLRRSGTATPVIDVEEILSAHG